MSSVLPPPLPRHAPPLPQHGPPPLPREIGQYCQGCQAEAPTRHVTFIRHIGAIVVGISHTTEGHFCRSCVNDHFARNTLMTSILGWWGIKSFFFTPVYLLLNIVHYANCRSLKPSPFQAEGGVTQARVALGVAGVCLMGMLALVYAIFFVPR